VRFADRTSGCSAVAFAPASKTSSPPVCAELLGMKIRLRLRPDIANKIFPKSNVAGWFDRSACESGTGCPIFYLVARRAAVHWKLTNKSSSLRTGLGRTSWGSVSADEPWAPEPCLPFDYCGRKPGSAFPGSHKFAEQYWRRHELLQSNCFEERSVVRVNWRRSAECRARGRNVVLWST
jgi:hypothetical protein